MHLLTNHGFMRLNDKGQDDRSTLVVLGLPRSGTSFLSSTLANLGVFLGDKAFSPTYEDKALKDAFDAGELNTLKQIVQHYDSMHDVWAVKLPRASYRPADLVSHLRSPRLLVSFRDPLAVHVRMQISQGVPGSLKKLRGIYEQYSSLVGNLVNLSLPMLLISYDKANSDAEYAVREIADFCGVFDELRIKAAIEGTRRDSKKYLDEARVNKSYGVVEVVQSTQVKGWAIHQDVKGKRPPEIQCRVNGELMNFSCRMVPRYDLNLVPKSALDQMGIRKEFVGRNLRTYEGRIGFELEFPNPVSGRVQLNVAGDHIPFFDEHLP